MSVVAGGSSALSRERWLAFEATEAPLADDRRDQVERLNRPLDDDKAPPDDARATLEMRRDMRELARAMAAPSCLSALLVGGANVSTGVVTGPASRGDFGVAGEASQPLPLPQAFALPLPHAFAIGFG